MNPTQLFDPASSTYTYVLSDASTREALIIDPVDEQLERDLATLERMGLSLKWAVETHAHADHITSAARLAELTGARTAAPAGCNVGTAARQLRDGDELRFGGETLRVLHTPGHTPGSMCFLVEGKPLLFSGDTLFPGGPGNTKLEGGDFDTIIRSVDDLLFRDGFELPLP